MAATFPGSSVDRPGSENFPGASSWTGRRCRDEWPRELLPAGPRFQYGPGPEGRPADPDRWGKGAFEGTPRGHPGPLKPSAAPREQLLFAWPPGRRGSSQPGKRRWFLNFESPLPGVGAQKYRPVRILQKMTPPFRKQGPLPVQTGPFLFVVGTDGLGVETPMKQNQVGRVAHQGPRIVLMVDPQRIKGREGKQQIPQRPLMYE